MSFIETRCRICTEEIRTKFASFHGTDVDHLKYKYKLKILFEDLVLEEDETTPFILCLFCIEKIRKTFEFRKLCLDAYQFWGIQFGREHNNSIDLNFKIIPSVENHFTRYEFIPTNTQIKETEKKIKTEKMDEKQIVKEIKKEIEDPVPLVGNMKNKLSSLLKLAPMEAKANVENPEAAPILSLTLLRRKRTYKNKSATPEKTTTSNKLDDVPKDIIKPILNINKLKQNLNKQINIAPIEVKTELDDDDDMPLNSLKLKLNEFNAKNTAATSLGSPLKLNIFNLKNKLGTALKTAQTNVLLEDHSKVLRNDIKPRKHGFIFDINYIIADKKNNIFCCKYCYKYFENVVALRYHIMQHGKRLLSKRKQIETNQKNFISRKKMATQCNICLKWFVNMQLHKVRAHLNSNNSKKIYNFEKTDK